jgi:hypothetical protein
MSGVQTFRFAMLCFSAFNLVYALRNGEHGMAVLAVLTAALWLTLMATDGNF